MNSDRSLLLLLLALCLLGLSCEESLPPREEPRDFLEAAIDGLEGDVVFRNGQPVSLSGSFYIRLTNIYDEPLQGEALVQADVDVYFKDFPEARATIRYGKSDLLNGWIITGGTITIDPNMAATFLKQWSHTTNEGTPFWEFVNLTLKHNQQGEPYLESDPMRFVARASVQAFTNVQPERTGEVEFTLVYQIF